MSEKTNYIDDLIKSISEITKGDTLTDDEIKKLQDVKELLTKVNDKKEDGGNDDLIDVLVAITKWIVELM